MQISISVRHGELGADTQERIREKAGKLTRFFDRLTSIDITIDLQRQDGAATELRVTAEHADDFVATSQAASVSAAVDGVLHKMEKQLRRHKDRVTDRRATGHRHLDVEVAPNEESGESEEE